MRSVLVCVRTSLAAQNLAGAAARLGVSSAVRTAVSEPEAMLRLSERPADVVLADTALTRPDTVGFTQRVLARAPGATIVLFGAEDPRTAAAAVAAGARGLIQGGDQDLVSVVAKAVLLLCVTGRMPAGVMGGPGRGVGPARLAPAPGAGTGPALPGAGTGPAIPGPGTGPAIPGGLGADPSAAMVPVQRGEEGAPIDLRSAVSAEDARFRPGLRDNVATGRFGRDEPATRRTALTERELQVLRGMADGKSNAEIGRELFVSEDTVKTHARRLFRKLGARDRAHAVAAGFRSGLVA